MQQTTVKKVEIATSDSWLSYVAFVLVILSTDAFLIKSILIDAEVTFDQLSLLRDNRVLISFDSSGKVTTILGIKHSFK